MGDTGDDFRAWHKQKQKKRAQNRATSIGILEARDIKFESKNNGAHLIVEGPDCKIDFWPGTGKFISRNGPKGRGVFRMLKLFETIEGEHV